MQKKSYAAYLFDFDYTLADSEKGIVSCFQHVFRAEGYAVPDDAIKRTIGWTLHDAFAALTGTDDEARLLAYEHAYVARADEIMTANTVLYPETLPLLRKLKEQGCAVAIISTKYRYRIEDTLRLYRASELVGRIIGREDVRAAKPDPQGVFLAMETFHVEKGAVLYTGDSLVDCHTAANAGVDFAAVTTGMTKAEVFAGEPHTRILSSLAQLP